MSHLKQRKSKVCLNCGTIVAGRYCQNCGQQNIEPHENFWHLLTHFVYDIFHFDGKFFNTVGALLFKPGLLSKEYIKGRRAAYLNPIQMYIFISAIFFLVFLSGIEINTHKVEQPQTAAQILEDLETSRKGLEISIDADKNYSNIDNAEKKALNGTIDLSKKSSRIEMQKNILDNVNADIAAIKADSSKAQAIVERNKYSVVRHDGKRYLSYAQYDSAQNALPANERENFFFRILTKNRFSLIGKYGSEREGWKLISERFLHTLPQMFFVSLPLFALVLQLLYVKRKQLYYVNHLIYALHLYSAIFLMMLVLIGVNYLSDIPHFGWMSWLEWLISIYAFVYSYKALHNFYGQKRRVAVFKFMILNLSAFILMVFLFVVFAVISMLIEA
ncbi:MAG: DUF3667 domain-containing protein [Chitinophagaceae bacterium]|nr:DUF3667 domain-containing protein [Chitinophagaceae bacterium]